MLLDVYFVISFYLYLDTSDTDGYERSYFQGCSGRNFSTPGALVLKLKAFSTLLNGGVGSRDGDVQTC